eukprot:g18554.t1
MRCLQQPLPPVGSLFHPLTGGVPLVGLPGDARLATDFCRGSLSPISGVLRRRFLCNYVFFQSLNAARPFEIPVLFVHVPLFKDMDQATQVVALLCLFIAIARQLQDAPPSIPPPSARPLG